MYFMEKQIRLFIGLILLNVFSSVDSTERKNETNASKNRTNDFPLFLAMTIENATLQANLSVWQKTEFEFVYLHGRSNHVQFDCTEIDETLGAFVSKVGYPHEISFYPPETPTSLPPVYLNYDQNNAENTTPTPYSQMTTALFENQTESPENSHWFSPPSTLQAENQQTPQYEETQNQYQTENLAYTKNATYNQQSFADYQNSSLNETHPDQVQNSYQTQTTSEYQQEGTQDYQQPSSSDSLQAVNSTDFENTSENAYDALNGTKLQTPQTTSSITSTQTIEGNDINAMKNTASQYEQESSVQQVDYTKSYQQQKPYEFTALQQNTNVRNNQEQQVDYTQNYQQQEPNEFTALQQNTNVRNNQEQQVDYTQNYQQQEPNEFTALRPQQNVLGSSNPQQNYYTSQSLGQVAPSDDETKYLVSQETNANHEKDDNLLSIEKHPNIVSLLSKDLLQLRNEYELSQQRDKVVIKDKIARRELQSRNEAQKRQPREIKEETSKQIFKMTREQNNPQNDGLKSHLTRQLQTVLKAKHQLKALTKDIHNIIDGMGDDEATEYKMIRRKRERGLRSLMNRHVKKPESLQSNSKTNRKPLVEEKKLSINDMWSINPSETNIIIQPSVGENDKNSRNSPEHGILMKIETMRNGFETRHDECPTFVIFGTSSKWCYTLTADPNNCAEEFLEVKDMFEKTCAETQFFIYARQRKTGQTWTDKIKSSTMNGVRVLVAQ